MAGQKQASTREMWTLIQEQRAELEALKAHLSEPWDEKTPRSGVGQGERLSRAGLLKTVTMGAAGVVGAAVLLEETTSVAGATGSEGATTFTSTSTTPAVTTRNTGTGTRAGPALVATAALPVAAATISNTGTGNALQANGNVTVSKGLSAATVSAKSGSTAGTAAAVRGELTSATPGMGSAAVLGQNDGTNGHGTGVSGIHNGTGDGVYGQSGATGVHGKGLTGVAGESGSDIGVYGRSGGSGGTGVYGQCNGGEGVYGQTGSSNGVHGEAVTGIGVHGHSAGSNGVDGHSDGSTAAGVYGESNNDGYGVAGRSKNSSGGPGSGQAVYGETGTGIGVYGRSSDASGNLGLGTGVYGDSAYVGVYGHGPTGVYCAGNFVATGTKNALVPFPDGTHRALYSVESPECWFEDFGSATLANGSAQVRIDPEFAATVRMQDYHVFLVPKGDCKGLYVNSQSSSGFVIHELQGGTSSIAFDYRIIAKRKDVEAPRLKAIELPKRPEKPGR
ncbi:MAG: hypothetical protein ACR2JC_00840 [Chloroflexota bacterium]|nr:MAG: hypothetical protein DLM70_01970 [Chloroflexota bacterium]